MCQWMSERVRRNLQKREIERNGETETSCSSDDDMYTWLGPRGQPC